MRYLLPAALILCFASTSPAAVLLSSSASVHWGNFSTPGGGSASGTSSASYSDGFSTDGSPNYTGSASATADYGSLSSSSSGSLLNPAFLQQIAGGGANFSDEMTVAGGSLSGSGYVAFIVTLAGSASQTGGGASGASLSLNGEGLASSVITGGTFTTSLIPITFGTAFDLQMALAVESTVSFTPDGTASGSFSAALSGMDVYDSSGTVLISPSLYTVTSGSATDYAALFAAPEPSRAVLMLLSLAGFAARRRRGR